MVRQRKDSKTLDLLAWKPPTVVSAFPEEAVRAASLRATVARAVSTALKDAENTRHVIAAEMTAFLGEDCPKSMLDAYASESRDDHVISLVRFIALAHATGDAQRLLQTLAGMFDLAVIQSRYVPAIEDAMLADQIEELKQRQVLSRRGWKGPR